MHIVGPIRLRTIHTKPADECYLKTSLDRCYIGTMGDDDVVKSKIDTVEFKDCDALGASHTIIGE